MMRDELSRDAPAVYDRCMRIVHVARVLVPERRRDEWTREWSGELWYRALLFL